MEILLHDYSSIDLDDAPDEHGRLRLVVDDTPECEVRGTVAYINKDAARVMVEHLNAVFGL